MNNLILRLTQWWKTAKWVAYAILGASGLIVMWCLRNLTVGKPPVQPMPGVKSPLQNKIDQVREEADVAKAKATVVADEHKKALDDLQKIPDDQVRRQKLADMLKTL